MRDGLPKVRLMESSSFHSPNVSARKKMPASDGCLGPFYFGENSLRLTRGDGQSNK